MDKREQYNAQFNGNEVLHRLISGVDPSRDLNSNVVSLKGLFHKPELTGAVVYLKENFSEKYPLQMPVFVKVNNITKNTLLSQLVNFVEKTLPVLCLKCDVEYTPMTQVDSAMDDVACIQCKIPAHRVCYLKNEININKGLVYLCQSCLVNIGKKEKITDKIEEDTELSEEDEGDANTNPWLDKTRKHRRKKSSHSTSSDDSDSSSDESKSKHSSPQGKKKKKKITCPMLIDGNCPHGAAGKECDYLHKRKCYKFSNYGTIEMHKGGCRYGDECKYLHPTLCRNSVELKTCLNSSCQYAHLKFTNRKKPMSNRNNYQSYNNSYAQSEYNNSYAQREKQRFQNSYSQPKVEEPRYKPSSSYDWNQRNQSSANSGPSMQHAFLEERLERMQKDILFQMKKQMEAQFQQMWGWESYEAQYPRLEPYN